MAKRITQETFNEAVEVGRCRGLAWGVYRGLSHLHNPTAQENVGEFGMSVEEAVEDAIKQFESQGEGHGTCLPQLVGACLLGN
jgi:hypothetical protein